MATTEEQRRRALVARLGRVRRRLTLERVLRLAVAPAWAFAVSAVAWHLVVQRGQLAFTGAAFSLGVAALAVRARGRAVSLAAAAALADRQVGAGGLLLTRLEVPVGPWELEVNQLARRIAPPPFEARRPLALVTLAVLFLGVGLWVPPPRPLAPRPNAAASAVVDRLEQQLDALAAEQPDDAAARAELERLQAELDRGAFDAPDWEAADALADASGWRAAEAGAALARAEAAAGALAAALAAGAGEQAEAAARDELERALMALDGGGAGRGAEDRPRTEAGAQPTEAAGGADGKPGQPGTERANAEALARALRERREALERPFARGGGAGAPPEPRGPRGGPGGTSSRPGRRGASPEGAREARGAAGAGGHGRESQGASRGEGRAGAGGVSRGPGAAELTFGEEAEIDPSRLAFDALPPGQGGEAGELRGLSAADPSLSQGSSSARPHAAASAGGDRGEGGRGRPLRPRNRAVVERYFGGGR